MHEVAQIATCVRCGKKFAGPQFVMLGLGAPDADTGKLIAFVEKLRSHIEVEHEDTANIIELQQKEFGGMLFLANFRSSDPKLAEQVDFVRWKTHQATLTCRVPDSKLRERCKDLRIEFETQASLGNWDAIEARLVEVMEGMRNILEEPGKYDFPAPSVVIQ